MPQNTIRHENTLNDELCRVANQLFQLNVLLILKFDFKEVTAVILEVGGHITFYREILRCEV